MPSAGWETVVSSKTNKSALNKGKNAASVAAQKKFVEKAPKLEDVLPMGQIHSIYNFDEAPAPKKPQDLQPVSPSKDGKKKAGKAPIQKAKEIPKVPSKPKNLEEAVKAFSVKDFKESLAQVKATYSSSHLLWLREAACHLNGKLATVETIVDCIDPSSKPTDLLSSKPLSAISKETRRVVTLLLEEISEAERLSGFETLLANLGHEMARDSDVNGQLIVLQMMADLHPTFVLPQNCKRASDLIKSYKNRPSVCLPLLWVLGQGGRKDLSVGIKVWCEYLRPLMRLKNYSRFVVSYLRELMDHHRVSERINELRSGPRLIYPEQFFLIFDAIFSEATYYLSKDLEVELSSVYPTLKDFAIGDCSVDHELFPEFLKRLDDAQLLSSCSKSYRDVLLSCLVDCVANNPSAVVSHWQHMYRTHLPGSSMVLRKLVADYDRVLRPSKTYNSWNLHFQELVYAFQEYNENCSSQKAGLKEARESGKELLKIMTQPRCRAWFPWKTLSFFLILGIGGVLKYDVQQKGSFATSNVGILLQDVGMYNKTVEAYAYTLGCYEFGTDWASKNIPAYYSYEFGTDWAGKNIPAYYSKARKTAGPYVAKAGDQARWAVTEAKKTGLLVMETVNGYVPGAKEKFFVFCDEAGRMSLLTRDWLVGRGKESLVLVRHAAASAQSTVQDVVDGKIELKDVFSGVKRLGGQAFNKLKEIGKTLA